MDGFIRAVTFLSRVAGVVGAFLIGFAVLAICDMVIERYIFNRTTIWQIDVVTYCVVAATFVGAPYVLLTRGHVNVDVVPLYGGLDGRVVQVSADSIYDEVEREAYFTVIVETERSWLGQGARRLPITPGMITDTQLITGRKSILRYLLKPFSKARSEALRER